jgi:ADP-ribosylglycohydrolase
MNDSSREFISLILDKGQLARLLGGSLPSLPAFPLQVDVVSKIRGALFGVAVGDALGWPYEGMTRDQIASSRPSLDGYVAVRRRACEPINSGAVSDDTQMTLDVARCLTEKKMIDPDFLLTLNSAYMIRGAGPIVLKALHHYRFSVPWHKCGVDSPYNGGAMRAIPVGLFHHGSVENILVDSILSCVTTHNNVHAMSATAVMAQAAAWLLRSDSKSFAGAVNTAAFVESLRSTALCIEGTIDADADRNSGVPTKIMSVAIGRLPGLLEEYRDNPFPAILELGNSVNAVESVSSALFCFLRNPFDYSDVVTTAVRDGNDCDSVASMAGGLCGALNGDSVIPSGYIDGLEDRELIENRAAMLADACKE